MSIDSQKDFEGIQRAGRAVAAALKAMEAHVTVGIATAELDEIGVSVLRAHGARSAPQIVYRFPGWNLISVNDEIVHGVPGTRRLMLGDVVKLDVTAEVDGYIADAATTVNVPPVSARSEQLRRSAIVAFDEACSIATAGRLVSAIGRAVERRVRCDGFAVLRQLTGHGVGRTIHEPLSAVEEDGVKIVEGRPDEAIMVRATDAARVVEACLSARVRRALLYPANLPAAFFDLSSGEAGEILQKLQSYSIRFAVVCTPGTVRFSSRFHEALGRYFQVFETRRAAREWLAGDEA